jgi:hypothetical protein
MVVQDSFDFTFSLPQSGHFAFPGMFRIIMARPPFAESCRFRRRIEFGPVGLKVRGGSNYHMYSYS